MARPRGNRKTARLTVSLDETVFLSLAAFARSEDVSIAWLARRAIHELIERNEAGVQQELPLPRRANRQGGE